MDLWLISDHADKMIFPFHKIIFQLSVVYVTITFGKILTQDVNKLRISISKYGEFYSDDMFIITKRNVEVQINAVISQHIDKMSIYGLRCWGQNVETISSFKFEKELSPNNIRKWSSKTELIFIPESNDDWNCILYTKHKTFNGASISSHEFKVQVEIRDKEEKQGTERNYLRTAENCELVNWSNESMVVASVVSSLITIVLCFTFGWVWLHVRERQRIRESRLLQRADARQKEAQADKSMPRYVEVVPISTSIINRPPCPLPLEAECKENAYSTIYDHRVITNHTKHSYCAIL